MSTSLSAVVALGANLGDRWGTLRAAVSALGATPAVRVVKCSPVVRSAPVGGPEGQPTYLNAVLELASGLSPGELLRSCQDIEAAHGRERTVRWGPRTLDIDIITCEGYTCTEEFLTVPHPRAHERAFVLVPWAMMDPGALLGGVPVREWAERAPDRATVSLEGPLE